GSALHVLRDAEVRDLRDGAVAGRRQPRADPLPVAERQADAAKPHQGNGPSPAVPNEKGGRTMSRRLSRRHVLRGAGVALALPWLEAMGPSGTARAATTAPAKRFMTVYFPNGASTLWWKTTGSGK